MSLPAAADPVDRARDRRRFPLPAHRRPAVRVVLWPYAGLAVGLLLGACSTPSGPKVELDQAAIARYRAAGYTHQVEEGVRRQRIGAPDSLVPWSVTLLSLPGTARRPVIVYLPALGDADDAPCRWLELWARAGYAVLSVQPLEDDARVWSTAAARSGDFEPLARSRFTAELLAERMARLARLLGQVRARSQSGDAALAELDWEHLALAGADLGAYTVQALAALPADRLAALGMPVTPRAYLAISPYQRAVDPAPQPAAHAGAPVLMVSSREDVDAYGVIADVSLRHQAFDQLIGGDDYYLEFAVATHRWLGGVAGAAPPTPAEPGAHRMAPMRQGGPNRGSSGGGGGADRLAPTEDDDLPAEARAKLAASRVEKAAQAARLLGQQLTRVQLSEVGFEDVTLAFLDANVRQQVAARDWLAKQAAEWLQDGDRLKHR